MIDYQAIKGQVTVEMAIDALNIRITKQDNPEQLRARCPHCQSSNDRMLSMNTERNVFTCFATKPNPRGDVIALVAHVRGTGQKEAAEWLLEQFPQQREGIPRGTRHSSKGGARKPKRHAAIRLIQTQQEQPHDIVVPFERPKPKRRIEPAPADDPYSLIDWMEEFK